MSWDWGYVCKSHEPNIKSEHWYHHGDDLLILMYHLVRADMWPKQPDPLWDEEQWGYQPVVHRKITSEGGDTYAVDWLKQHPNCEIALQDEYGKEKPIPNKTMTGSVTEFYKELYTEQIYSLESLRKLVIFAQQAKVKSQHDALGEALAKNDLSLGHINPRIGED